MRELDLIRWIRSRPQADPRIEVGPGDDCAVVRVGTESLLVTTDQVLDGVHIVLSHHSPADAGRKALARNLSDIAAMGGRPLAAFVNVVLPQGVDEQFARDIHEGIGELGAATECPLAGGDVAVWKGRLCVGVTVLGRPGPGGPVLRSGGLQDDALCVTGSLGGSWRGDRHVAFAPRLAEGRALAERYNAHAMIDLSDGLATDLRHLCLASNVGAELFAPSIPIHEDVRDDDPLRAALTDGEDYELLVALSVGDASRLMADQPFDVPVRRIGTLTGGSGIVLVDDAGRRRDLHEAGWEHST